MFRMVLIEDEPPLLRRLAEKIKRIDSDFSIVGAYETGEDALIDMDIMKPHVILTDIRMPVMDGLTLIQRVKERHPNVFCSIISGYQDFDYARKAIKLGVNDYLVKPPSNEDIRDLLSRIKNQLLKDQQLMEAEILRELLLSPSKVHPFRDNHFHYEHYILYYAFCPEQAGCIIPGDAVRRVIEADLWEGEKLYSIPSLENECIHVIGVRHRQMDRLSNWMQSSSSKQSWQIPSCTVLVTMDGIQNLFVNLKQARSAALYHYRFGQQRAIFLNDQLDVAASSRLDVETTQLHHLTTFLNKMQFKEFDSHFEWLIEELNFTHPRASNVQWVKTLSYILEFILLESSYSYCPETARKWQLDLEHAVWQAVGKTDLVQNLKEIFSQLFATHANASKYGWIDEVEEFIRIHFTKNITLGDLASQFNLNPTYLSRVFKREKGNSPIEYLTKIRIQTAKFLISQHPRLLYKDIAEQVGYSDPYYFSKLFKQWTGETPSEFKRKCLNAR